MRVDIDTNGWDILITQDSCCWYQSKISLTEAHDEQAFQYFLTLIILGAITFE